MKRPILILFLTFLGCISSQAQTELKSETPKVGLVLSGGGAKGLAHIGVLKVIDSLGVDIDYIGGTSMGAIVAGLYASGYSGKELDSIFSKADFENIIIDNLPRASKGFFERNNDEKYAIKLPFDDFKLKLPSALSRGQNAYNYLLKLLLHVNEIEDFSKLPIPFFCIATNVETGQQVILEKGNLPKSIMASGALPTLFQPVNLNGQLLIDGGVVNNYPIDELRARGVDIVIGVDVQDGLMNRTELTSAPDVLLQINNFRTIKDMEIKSKKTDIYIKPDIKDFNVVSFDAAKKIIDLGWVAAKRAQDKLKTLASKEGASSLSLNTKSYVQDSIKINKISLSGLEKYTRSYVLGKLKLKSDEKISYSQLNKGINSLVATNNFDVLDYQLKTSEEKPGYDFYANLKEADNATFLKFGVHYDDLYKSGALFNITRKHLFFDNDIASLDVVLGDNLRYNFDFLIDKGFYLSVGIRSSFNDFHKNISAELLLNDSELDAAGLNKIDVELQDQTNQFYLQTLFRKDFSLSLGAEHKRLEISSETLAVGDEDDEFIFENTDYVSLFSTLQLDTYDNKYFPKKGLFFNGDLHYYFYASHFNEGFDAFAIAKADLGYAFSISDNLALNLQTSGGFKLGDKSTQTLDFALGGYGNNLINNFVPFLGYDFISLTGNSYVKAYAGLDYEIFNKHHVTLEGNWANIEDNIFDTGEWFTLPTYRGYALGYAIDTFLGPIQVKYSYSPERNKSIWFFNLGYWF
ncbi:patatin-like phospholipase family protein [Seonamhaeicola sp. ML3]|uniref:patatin-like phospholipase family protein n=1 Tax=Seonamhaeicola sp. ML3 TaxID=2937786 RepID=UPI00200F4C29|nr:patatin-like phospholipase family protein [Seonamhaeicola sp. ML3]